MSDSATVLRGRDQVNFYRAAATRGALRLCSAGMRPSRGLTVADLLRVAGEYTGKTYKRGQVQQAIEDLTKWVDGYKREVSTNF
jgi:hypothetical protein